MTGSAISGRTASSTWNRAPGRAASSTCCRPGGGIGIDIDPRRDGILRHDFLTWPFEDTIEDPRHTVVVGNPPFGHRSKLAIRFFNRAAAMANTIAFVVPVQFRKYSVHKNLRPGFRWIATLELEGPAFYTRAEPDYRLNAEFQVWTREANHDFEDMRLLSPPAIRHADFEMWQYNNTPEALKVFDHDLRLRRAPAGLPGLLEAGDLCRLLRADQAVDPVQGGDPGRPRPVAEHGLSPPCRRTTPSPPASGRPTW